VPHLRQDEQVPAFGEPGEPAGFGGGIQLWGAGDAENASPGVAAASASRPRPRAAIQPSTQGGDTGSSPVGTARNIVACQMPYFGKDAAPSRGFRTAFVRDLCAEDQDDLAPPRPERCHRAA
jgi:hypothetical protein